MALNKIYEFAQVSLNILNDVDYLADPTLEDGILAGSKARSELHNKIFKQATLCAAGLSQFTADNQDEDIDDAMTVAEYADALTAAIDSRVNIGIGTNIVTQPQFDNQELAATDEFVNRALGSYSLSRIVSTANTTLSADDVGKIVAYSPSVSQNAAITLPDYTTPSNFRLGAVIEVINISQYSPNVVVVSPSAGQNLLTRRNADLSQIILNNGDNAKFVLAEVDSTKYWVLIDGTVSLKYSKTFDSYTAIVGHTYLPGGLLFQWGRNILPNNGDESSSCNVTLDIEYPTAIFNVFGNGNSSVNSSVRYNPIITFENLSTTGFTAVGATNSYNEDHDFFNQDVFFHWFSIGH